MQVCVVGVNHQTTPVGIRGKLAIGADGIRQALFSLSKNVSPGVILSTCNRTEVYVSTEEEAAVETSIVNFLNARSNLPQAEILPYIYSYRGKAAVRHLFRVASGLDSMIIGEFEILGQVKRALDEVAKTTLVELPLLELFRHAVRVGRRVRNETGISKNAISVSSVAVDLAAQVVNDICHSKVVVIGAGEAGSLVAKTSRERGVAQVVVVSRSKKKGTALAAMLNGIWTPMENLRQELITADIVISCSGAPHSILKSALVEEVMNTRPEPPLVIVDIAVPQDVEPQIRQIKNVFLYDIDKLTKLSDSNQKRRQREILTAMQIVDEEVEKFVTRWQELEVKPVISALVKKAEKIRQAQFDCTLKQLPGTSTEELVFLETMTKSIVHKILRIPIRRLKSNHHQEDFIQTVKELFDLDRENQDEK
ncbi:glutamyl-tRNA reductase [Chloroflexota bacterium]